MLGSADPDDRGGRLRLINQGIRSHILNRFFPSLNRFCPSTLGNGPLQ